jgi:hypothetical protein
MIVCTNILVLLAQLHQYIGATDIVETNILVLLVLAAPIGEDTLR